MPFSGLSIGFTEGLVRSRTPYVNAFRRDSRVPDRSRDSYRMPQTLWGRVRGTLNQMLRTRIHCSWPLMKDMTQPFPGKDCEESHTDEEGATLTHQKVHQSMLEDDRFQTLRCPPNLQPSDGLVSFCARTRSWTFECAGVMPLTVSSEECEVSFSLFVCLVLADVRLYAHRLASQWVTQAVSRLQQSREGDWRVSWRQGGRRHFRRFATRQMAVECLQEVAQVHGSTLAWPACAKLRSDVVGVKYTASKGSRARWCVQLRDPKTGRRPMKSFPTQEAAESYARTLLADRPEKLPKAVSKKALKSKR